jgi:hypothetical protein
MVAFTSKLSLCRERRLILSFLGVQRIAGQEDR